MQGVWNCFTEAVTHCEVWKCRDTDIGLAFVESSLAWTYTKCTYLWQNLSEFVILGMTMLSSTVITAEVEAKAARRPMITDGHLHMMWAPRANDPITYGMEI